MFINIFVFGAYFSIFRAFLIIHDDYHIEIFEILRILIRYSCMVFFKSISIWHQKQRFALIDKYIGICNYNF